MKWVKHDTDAHIDAKLQNVLLDYGLEGYGLYWYCIELIAGRVDKDNITFELEHDARIIARNTGSSAQKVEEMMRYFVSTGLFEDTEGTVTCLKLAKRLDKSMTSNPEMRELIFKLKNHDKVMTQSAKPMQDKTRLDKSIKTLVDDSTPVDEKIVKQKKAVIPYQQITDMYNEILGSEFRAVIKIDVTGRKTKIKNFWNDMGKDLSTCERYFKHYKVNAQDWERGHGDRNWVADMENIIKDKTVERMRAG